MHTLACNRHTNITHTFLRTRWSPRLLQSVSSDCQLSVPATLAAGGPVTLCQHLLAGREEATPPPCACKWKSFFKYRRILPISWVKAGRRFYWNIKTANKILKWINGVVTSEWLSNRRCKKTKRYLHPCEHRTAVDLVVGDGGEAGQVGGQHPGHWLLNRRTTEKMNAWRSKGPDPDRKTARN